MSEDDDSALTRIDLKMTLSGRHATAFQSVRAQFNASSYPEALRMLLTRLDESSFVILSKTDADLLHFLLRLEQEKAVPSFYDMESIMVEALKIWKDTHLQAVNLGSLEVRNSLTEHELVIANVLWQAIFDTEKFYFGVTLDYLIKETGLPQKTIRDILKVFARTRLIKVRNQGGKTYYLPRR
ncbi:MAG: hypothetical protein ACFFD4_33340 [Candidatus Odinarchaeota archaeon]